MPQTPTPPIRDISVAEQMVASSSGALLTSLLMTPMDVVKTRLQTQIQPLAKGECFLYNNGLMEHLCTACADTATTSPAKCEWFNRPGHFNGTVDAFVKISRTEGVRSLWSGLSPTIVSAIPQTVFYFTLYDNLHALLSRELPASPYLAPLLAGSGARAVAATVVSPLEMVRTKMQSEVLSYRELGRALKVSVRQDGYRAMWRGLLATLLRDVPFSAVYWVGYEYLKARLLVLLRRPETSFPVSFCAGGLSGGLATVLTQPFDVVKTHKQITLGRVGGRAMKRGQACPGDKSMRRVMAEIVAREGAAGLWTGLTPRLAKTSMACAIMIGTYEYLKLLFKRRTEPTC